MLNKPKTIKDPMFFWLIFRGVGSASNLTSTKETFHFRLLSSSQQCETVTAHGRRDFLGKVWWQLYGLISSTIKSQVVKHGKSVVSENSTKWTSSHIQNWVSTHPSSLKLNHWNTVSCPLLCHKSFLLKLEKVHPVKG